MTATDTRLIVLENQAARLIRAEVYAMDERRMLERAVRESINKLGASTSEISAVTGLAPREINRILAEPEPLEDLNALAGVA